MQKFLMSCKNFQFVTVIIQKSFNIMSSLNPPLSKSDFINSGPIDVINSTERKDCLAYSEVFWKKADLAKETGNVREQAVFEIMAVVTGVTRQSESTEEFFAKIFQNFSDEHLNFLVEIAPLISDAELQARVADILWSIKRDLGMAHLAVTAYLQSAMELEDPHQWSLCFNRIERALNLARKINYQNDWLKARTYSHSLAKWPLIDKDPLLNFAGMFNDDPLFDDFIEDMAAYRRELDTQAGINDFTAQESQSA